SVEASCHLRVESVERFSGDVTKLRDELDTTTVGDRVVIACHNEAESKRLGEVLSAGQLAQSDRLRLVTGRVRAGFRMVDAGVVVLGGQELFHREEVRQVVPRRRLESRAIDSFLDLAEDDLVVHVSHGIARYHGMEVLETKPGIALPPDTEWQAEFEAAFAYQETPDQLTTLVEMKRDMERARPMDRLICGDVGYGKTELAIRAAFKTIDNGRQVAVLVPTTVLAEQHFRTFSQRLAEYPFVVESISRFRSHGEQERIVERLASGGGDIIIGTHRLVSADVRFKDLGLVIIDE